jgi:hypothetical protein
MQTPQTRKCAGTTRQFTAMLLTACAVVAATGTLAAVEKVVFPDGTAFPFWDDRTDYRATYHVACQNPQASDANPGTREKPWRTIARAAEMLQPGEKILIDGRGRCTISAAISSTISA